MSRIGNILIFLQMFFSLMFMAFAGAVYTAQTNWKTAAENANKSVSKAKSDMTTAEGAFKQEKTALEQQISQLNDTVTQLTGDRTTAKKEAADLLAENTRLRLAADNLRESARLNGNEASDRKSESDLTRAKNAELVKQQEDLSNKLRTLEDKYFAQSQQTADIERKYNVMLDQMSKMRAFLASKNLTTDVREMTALTSPPPPLTSKVLSSRKRAGSNDELVELTNGSDDGLVIGNLLTVSRGPKYVGRIRLIQVDSDHSVGLLVEKNKNETVQEGDHASTQF